MTSISLKRLNSHRTRTFNLPPSKRLSSQSQALTFVNQRGFVYFWPIKDVDLPSLWTAVAGNRPVADKHDDPGHITWGWKDVPKKYHIAIKTTLPRFNPVGKYATVEFRENCAGSCRECVKKKCVYDIFKNNYSYMSSTGAGIPLYL